MPRIGVVLLTVLLAGAAQTPGDFDCFAVSDLEKVFASGAFHENVSVRPGRSTIEVKARLAGVEKTATRSFQVLE